MRQVPHLLHSYSGLASNRPIKKRALAIPPKLNALAAALAAIPQPNTQTKMNLEGWNFFPYNVNGMAHETLRIYVSRMKQHEKYIYRETHYPK